MRTKLNLIAIAVFGLGAFSMMNQQESLKSLTENSYKVIRVNGKIMFVKTASDMKQGDAYVEGTPIKFNSAQARAAIINKIRGRFVLSEAKKGKPIVLPATNNIASRSGALINKIDLQNHFSGNYLVLEKLALEISEKAYPQNEKSFFYLAYEYKGEVIRKKLPFTGNKVILDRDNIFKIDNEAIPVQKLEMSLYYMDEATGEKLAKFTPVFPDLDILKSEVHIIIAEGGDKPKEDRLREITSYLNEFYGKPQKDNLEDWLVQSFDI
ncbi:hypothetical protein [Putridiphycobacter roseus]|nr:hypothetical protein [Putridiphycobacter roseus]